MAMIRIKENSEQAKIFLAYIRTLPFVEFVEDLPAMAREQEAFYRKFQIATREAKEIAEGRGREFPL